jgi:hypothetical protein
MMGQPYRQAGYRQQDGRIDGGAGILTGPCVLTAGRRIDDVRRRFTHMPPRHPYSPSEVVPL